MSVNEDTPEPIARGAHEISSRGASGTVGENWRHTEHELREGRRPEPEGSWAKTSSGNADSVSRTFREMSSTRR
jgi:hypothetical protein